MRSWQNYGIEESIRSVRLDSEHENDCASYSSPQLT